MTTTPRTTTGLTETDSELKRAAKDKEQLVFQDEGVFKHCTGDVYTGRFEIKKREHVAKMLGPGVYFTNEGDSYTGNWEHDNLKEAIIRYTTYARYEGPLKDWCYSGPGLYYYPDETVLQADFQDNCPIGQLTIQDPNGHTWRGKAENGFAWFNPANHYYDMLETKPKKTKNSSKLKITNPPPKEKGRKEKSS